MSDHTKISTLGPADPNAPMIQKFYTVVASLAGLVSVASTFGMVTGEQAASLGQVATTGTAFVTAIGVAVASFRTKKQVNNGTFDAAPEDVERDAFQSLNAIKTKVDETVSAAQAKVTDGFATIQSAAALIPGGAPILTAVMDTPVGDLIRAVGRDEQP